MRTPTDDLFQLIKSMTPAEKRFLKQHFDLSDNLKIQLFDLINRQEVYDEAAIKAHFKGTAVARNLKVHKAQLTDLLINSLISGKHAQRKQKSAQTLLTEAQVLYEKNQLKLALKKVDKALEKTYKEELYLLRLSVLGLKKKLLHSARVQSLIGGEKEVLELRRTTHEQSLKALTTYKLLLDTTEMSRSLMEYVHLKNPSGEIAEVQQSLQKVLSLAEEVEQKQSLTVKLQFTGLLKICYVLLKDVEKFEEVSKQQIELVQDQFHDCPKRIQPTILRGTSNFLRHLAQQNKHEEFDKVLSIMDNWLRDKHLSTIFDRSYIYGHQLQSYLNRGLFRQMLNLRPAIQQHLKRHQLQQRAAAESIEILMSVAALALNEMDTLKQSLSFLQKQNLFLSINATGAHEVLQLIFDYEEGSHQKVAKRVKKLKKQTDAESFLYHWLELFEVLATSRTENQTMALKKARSSLAQEQFSEYAESLHLQQWITAQLNGSSFREEMLSEIRNARH